ncbi:MAG: hypothetical protein JWQ72_2744 [Polaromonas sp.]|nr:hypothetical protein [Polaromonas sp.]
MRSLAGLMGVWCASVVHASNNWLTFVGDPSNSPVDYIQFDPSALVAQGDIRTIPVRVSSAQPRTSLDGIVYRSVTGVAAINCTTRSARFLHAAFYELPEFAGTPFLKREAGPELPPMSFVGLDRERAQRVIKAACTPG